MCYTDKIDDNTFNDKYTAKSSRNEKFPNNSDKLKPFYDKNIYSANAVEENNENDKLLRSMETTIETKSCITVLQCHPTIPFILAVGTCNGMSITVFKCLSNIILYCVWVI